MAETKKADKTAENQPTASTAPVGTPDGDDAILISAGEAPSGAFDDAGADEFVTVNKDVVQEFYFPDTKRPSYRTLFTKGQVVRRSVIDALEAEAQRRSELDANDGVDPENPAGIDSTTIASGTQVKLDEGGKGK